MPANAKRHQKETEATAALVLTPLFCLSVSSSSSPSPPYGLHPISEGRYLNKRQQGKMTAKAAIPTNRYPVRQPDSVMMWLRIGAKIAAEMLEQAMTMP